jgi:Mg/Co/Ni transporter MgtE
VGFWLWASKQAWKELRKELLTPLKIGFSLGLTLLSLAVQYRFGVRDWHLTLLSAASLVIAFAAANLVALAGRTLSMPPRLISGTLQIR